MSNNLRLTGILQAFDRWGYDSNGWSANTRRIYVGRVRPAHDWLKQNRGKGTLRATVDDLRDYLFSIKLVARTRNNYRQALVAFGRYMKDEGKWSDNRARFLPTIKEPRSLPRALDLAVARDEKAGIESRRALAPDPRFRLPRPSSLGKTQQLMRSIRDTGDADTAAGTRRVRIGREVRKPPHGKDGEHDEGDQEGLDHFSFNAGLSASR